MPVSLLARQGPARYCASDQYRFPGSMLIRLPTDAGFALSSPGPCTICVQATNYRFPGSKLIRCLYYINIIIIVKYSWKEKGNRFISNHPISRQTCLN